MAYGGSWQKVTPAEHKIIKTLCEEYAKDPVILAKWLGISVGTVEKWLTKGATWRSKARDRTLLIFKECKSKGMPQDTSYAQPGKSLSKHKNGTKRKRRTRAEQNAVERQRYAEKKAAKNGSAKTKADQQQIFRLLAYLRSLGHGTDVLGAVALFALEDGGELDGG